MTTKPILNLSELLLLMDAITESKYSAMRSVSTLQLILSIADNLKLEIERAKPAAISNEVRMIRILSKQCEIHRRAINKRIRQIERTNQFKYRRARLTQSELELVRAVIDSGTLAKANRERSQLAERVAIDQVKIEHLSIAADSRLPEIRSMLKAKQEQSQALATQGDEMAAMLNKYQTDKDSQPIDTNPDTNTDLDKEHPDNDSN